MWNLQDVDGGRVYLEQDVRVPNLKSRETETLVISEGFSEENVENIKEIFH